MEPKFQSSFIPKGPSSVIATSTPLRRTHHKGFLDFVATTLFFISIIFAGGVFGYKVYLNYTINQMGEDLEAVRASLEQDKIDDFTRLNNRLVNSKSLIANHKALTPLFSFVEQSTPTNLRFNSFRFDVVDNNIELTMLGEARGYATLALLSEIFHNSGHFQEPVFSDLKLNERGDVEFTFKASVNSELVSYKKLVDVPSVLPSQDQEATSTTQFPNI